MKKKTTLDDIAKELNITKVSVSKALRDHPDISDLTKLKVKETARKLGYKPNLIARSLTSSRSRTLGVIVPKIAHNFFAHVVAGVQKYASEMGYEILLTVSEENEDLERKHIETLVSMQVEGLLISVSMKTKDISVYKWLRDIQVPMVFFDRYIPDLGFNSVIINDRLAAKHAVEQLILQGCSRIAHLSGYDHISIGQQRRIGYQEALNEHGIEINPALIVEGGFGEGSGYKGFKELMKRNMNIDALFAVTFPVGLGTYVAMREQDPTMIDKIKMLAFGDSGIRGIVPYPHYYVDQPGTLIGQKATELLLKEIEGELKPVNHLEYVPTRFLKAGWDFSLESIEMKKTDY